MRKTPPSSAKSNMPKVKRGKGFRLPEYRDLEELMTEAERLGSAMSEVATLCKRMRTDLRALERRNFKQVVGFTKMGLLEVVWAS